METVTYQDTLSRMTCGECGIAFAVPEQWRAKKKENGSDWYCPNGHVRVYRESDVAIAERKLAMERQAHDQTKARARDAEATARKELAKAKRLRTRAANGVCPCCKRSFKELARHMTTKHPDYAKGATP